MRRQYVRYCLFRHAWYFGEHFRLLEDAPVGELVERAAFVERKILHQGNLRDSDDSLDVEVSQSNRH